MVAVCVTVGFPADVVLALLGPQSRMNACAASA